MDLLKVWRDLLDGIPDDRIEAAVFELCKTAQHPPVPRDIAEKVREMFPAKVAAHHEFTPEPGDRGAGPEVVRSLLEQARRNLARRAS